MFGRLLCIIGWHDWGYRTEDGHVLPGNDRWTARALVYRSGYDYRCLRCGIRP